MFRQSCSINGKYVIFVSRYLIFNIRFHDANAESKIANIVSSKCMTIFHFLNIVLLASVSLLFTVFGEHEKGVNSRYINKVTCLLTTQNSFMANTCISPRCVKMHDGFLRFFFKSSIYFSGWLSTVCLLSVLICAISHDLFLTVCHAP